MQKPLHNVSAEHRRDEQYRMAVGCADGVVRRTILYLNMTKGVICEQRDIKGEDVLSSLSLKNNHLEVSALAFSTDGERLGIGGADGSVRVWNWSAKDAEKSVISLFGHSGYINSWPGSRRQTMFWSAPVPTKRRGSGTSNRCPCRRTHLQKNCWTLLCPCA